MTCSRAGGEKGWAGRIWGGKVAQIHFGARKWEFTVKVSGASGESIWGIWKVSI